MTCSAGRGPSSRSLAAAGGRSWSAGTTRCSSHLAPGTRTTTRSAVSSPACAVSAGRQAAAPIRRFLSVWRRRWRSAARTGRASGTTTSSASPSAGWRSSTCTNARTSRCTSARCTSSSTARSTTTASCATSCARWGTPSRPRATARCSCTRGPSGARARSTASMPCSRWRSGRGERRLVLASDPFGEKPLYYARAGRAARLRLRDQGALPAPGVPRAADDEAVAPVPGAQRDAGDGAELLPRRRRGCPAAHLLRMARRPRQRPPLLGAAPRRGAVATTRTPSTSCASLLTDSIRLRLRSDVPSAPP